MQAASSHASNSDDVFNPSPDTSISATSHYCSIDLRHLSLSCKTPRTEISPSSPESTMSEGHSNSLNFSDTNRTPANAGAPQQPPDQSTLKPSNSNAPENAQPSAEGLRLHLPDSRSGGTSPNLPRQPAAPTVSSHSPPKNPASSSIKQRGIEPPTPERQIRHIKDLLLNLQIRIASCETHAKRQGIRREETWVKFEVDRMCIQAHQKPDRRLNDHWKVIIENQVPFETLQLGVPGGFESDADI